MSVLVNDKAVVKRNIPLRIRRIKEIHSHHRLRSIDSLTKLPIVLPTPMLRLNIDVIVCFAPLTEIVTLHVTRGFRETQCVQKIVVLVRRVEDLRERRELAVLDLRILSVGRVWVFEGQTFILREVYES